jgi:hypothetical protein
MLDDLGLGPQSVADRTFLERTGIPCELVAVARPDLPGAQATPGVRIVRNRSRTSASMRGLRG